MLEDPTDTELEAIYFKSPGKREKGRCSGCGALVYFPCLACRIDDRRTTELEIKRKTTPKKEYNPMEPTALKERCEDLWGKVCDLRREKRDVEVRLHQTEVKLADTSESLKQEVHDKLVLQAATRSQETVLKLLASVDREAKEKQLTVQVAWIDNDSQFNVRAYVGNLVGQRYLSEGMEQHDGVLYGALESILKELKVLPEEEGENDDDRANASHDGPSKEVEGGGN